MFPSAAPSGGRDEISTSGILTASSQNSSIQSSSGPNNSLVGNQENNNDNESNNNQNQSKISSEIKSSDSSGSSSSDSDTDSDMDERKKQKFTLEHLFQPKKPTILTEFIARSPSSSSDYNSDSVCNASKLLEVEKNQISVI